MKRSNIETLVLVVGILIIAAAIFMMYGMSETPHSILIVFSVGFLSYILYSIMSTNSLNREIRHLGNHISSLKTEIEKKNKLINERDSQIEVLEEEKAKISEEIVKHEKQIEELQKKIVVLESSQTDTSL